MISAVKITWLTCHILHLIAGSSVAPEPCTCLDFLAFPCSSNPVTVMSSTDSNLILSCGFSSADVDDDGDFSHRAIIGTNAHGHYICQSCHQHQHRCPHVAELGSWLLANEGTLDEVFETFSVRPSAWTHLQHSTRLGSDLDGMSSISHRLIPLAFCNERMMERTLCVGKLMHALILCFYRCVIANGAHDPCPWLQEGFFLSVPRALQPVVSKHAPIACPRSMTGSPLAHVGPPGMSGILWPLAGWFQAANLPLSATLILLCQ